MVFLSFVKEAGEKLLNPAAQSGQAVALSAGREAPSAAEIERLQRSAAAAIHRYIETQNLPVRNLTVGYNADIATVTVLGEVADQATREKIMPCCGNVVGVRHVNDQMMLRNLEKLDTRYYSVVSGDTLDGISVHFYGDASRSPQIFEANQPMLASPDLIYPGQMLRIPPH